MTHLSMVPSWPVRRFAGWLFACLMAVLLAACIGDGDDSDAVAPAGTAPTITTQPAGATVTPPATATFTVAATGSDPLAYQWQKNGSAIAGATAATYTTPATVDADTGALFTVVVSNAVGSVTSTAATLTVGPQVIAPSVVTQPMAQTVAEPATATFMASFNGTAPLSYQWTRNSVAIAGATAASYTTPATTVAADNGALYAVTATNAGGSAKTQDATLTVNPMPTPVSISAQPTAQSVTTGATATFNVTAAGDAPISYQWFRNGTAITGATAASYTTAATVAADNGAVFKVTVTNPANSVTSSDAALTVTDAQPQVTPPVITAQPANVSPVVGAAASFSVTATSSVPVTYQWFREDVAITGATAATYTIASVVQADDGAKFKVMVSNSAGSVTSTPATLSITPQPPVIAGPVAMTVVAGQTATFSVTVTGTSPFTYQWRKNGTAIAGATAASYTTPATTTADNNAMFTVVVANTAGPVTSAAATLTVAAFVAAAIDTQPANASTANGTTATFTVVAHGTAPLAYQWSKNGTAIPGATAAIYTTPVVSFADDQAKFTVVVSNTATNGVTSSQAVLTVTLPSTPVVQVVASDGLSIALRQSGALYSWGDWVLGRPDLNALAGAGPFGTFSPGSPVRARNVDNTPFLSVASVSAGVTHSALVKTDGTVWVWGNASRPDLGWCPIGDGACVTRTYPTQVKDASGVPMTGVRLVAGGYYFNVALKADGTVWGWGDNDSGKLGDGTTTDRLNPVQVIDPTTGGFFTAATAVAANVDHSMALKSDGTVYAWGNNNDGEIGDGTTSTGIAVPKRVEVSPGVPVYGITAIAAGERHSVALKSDGTVYAWGYNANGALGDGTTTNRLRATVMRDTAGNPVTGIVAIAAGQNFTILLKSDGTVLATGQNDIGQLGDNSTAAYQINPVLVRDAAGAVFGSVAAISSYHEHTVVYRTDGTVWAWGLNDSRQLGDTTNVNRRNPVPAPAYVP